MRGGADRKLSPAAQTLSRRVNGPLCLDPARDRGPQPCRAGVGLGGHATTASVTLTKYSPTISGNIDPGTTGNAGVKVALTLTRAVNDATNATRDVATATATTADDGSWSATLTPENPASGPTSVFGISQDALSVTYSPGSTGVDAPQGTTYVESYPAFFSPLADDRSRRELDLDSGRRQLLRRCQLPRRRGLAHAEPRRLR